MHDKRAKVCDFAMTLFVSFLFRFGGLHYLTILKQM